MRIWRFNYKRYERPALDSLSYEELLAENVGYETFAEDVRYELEGSGIYDDSDLPSGLIVLYLAEETPDS